MKKNYGIFVLLSVAMGLTACDDGSIPRKEHTATHTGFAAKLTGHITGADSWPEYYQLVLAGFGDSEYATTQVLVSPDANSNVSLTLPNIGSNVKTIELCVTNRLLQTCPDISKSGCSFDFGEIRSTWMPDRWMPTCMQPYKRTYLTKPAHSATEEAPLPQPDFT